MVNHVRKFLVERFPRCEQVHPSPVRQWVEHLATVPDSAVSAARARLAVVKPATAHMTLRRLTHSQYNNTVRDLLGRWQTDVLDLKPDWVAVMIGINDVWRQFDSPRQPEAHVGLEEYETTLDDLIERTQHRVDMAVAARGPVIVYRDRSAEEIRAVADRAFQQCRPLTNIIVDPDWRRAMVAVEVRRALEALTPGSAAAPSRS